MGVLLSFATASQRRAISFPGFVTAYARKDLKVRVFMADDFEKTSGSGRDAGDETGFIRLPGIPVPDEKIGNSIGITPSLAPPKRTSPYVDPNLRPVGFGDGA